MNSHPPAPPSAGSSLKLNGMEKRGDINSTLETLIIILEEALIYNHLEDNVDVELPVYLGWLSREIEEGQKPGRELFRKFEALYKQFIEKIYRKNRIIRESLSYSFKKYGQSRFPPEHWWWYVD